MKFDYDCNAGCLYVRFLVPPVAEREELRPGIMLDFDRDGRMVTIETIEASRQLADPTDPKVMSAA